MVFIYFNGGVTLGVLGTRGGLRRADVFDIDRPAVSSLLCHFVLGGIGVKRSCARATGHTVGPEA